MFHEFEKLEQESLIFAFFMRPERTNLFRKNGDASR